MKTVLIGCKTLENELCAAIQRTDWAGETVWIESGLHNVPQRLHDVLQEKIDVCQDFDRILLGMGFCGNALADIRTGSAEIILPRADDCISLLCGSAQKRAMYHRTYFFTDGWLRGERTIWNKYEHSLKKYGECCTKQIFHDMLCHYEDCALLETGCFETEPAEREVRRIAGVLGLSYRSIPGTIDYLCDLLTGPWPETRFLTCRPNSIIERASLLLPEFS